MDVNTKEDFIVEIYINVAMFNKKYFIYSYHIRQNIQINRYCEIHTSTMIIFVTLYFK